MRKSVKRLRALSASAVATTMMLSPVAFLLFFDVNSPGDSNDSWQRGIPLAPIIFLIALYLCHRQATWLLANGYSSLRRFAVGASLGSAGMAVALTAPAVIVGSFIGMFALTAAALPLLVFSLCAGILALPSAMAWWLIAGQSHNKPIHATCENARA